jgi:single-strand DNA-binding protein
MTNLNSVLLEGKVIADPVCTETGENMADTTFTIEVVREHKEDGKVVRIERTFRLIATGRLGTVCAEYLKKGRGIRAVGRLDTDTEGVFMAAEHVEFKPVKTAVHNKE